MTCDPQSLLEAARCFGCIPAGMLASVGTNLLCQLTNRPGGLECDDPQVIDWLARIDSDPTAIRPPDNVIDAVCVFCKDLRSAGIFNKMLVVNPVIPPTDGTPASLRAMQYPLIYQPANGISPFINSGFVIGDLTIDGLRGSGTFSDKWMDTRFNPSIQWGNPEDNTNILAGLTTYEFDISNDPAVGTFETEIGCVDLGSTTSHLICCHHDFAGGFLSYCWSAATGIVVFPRVDITGYYSSNREAIDVFKAYHARSTIPHNLIGQNLADGTVDPVPNEFEYFMAQNNGGAGIDCTAKRISFMAIHEALTQSESLAFYNAIQKMRMSFGGGFV